MVLVTVVWSVGRYERGMMAKCHGWLSGNSDLGSQELNEQPCSLLCKLFLGCIGCMYAGPVRKTLHSRGEISGKVLKAKGMRCSDACVSNKLI